MASAANQIAFLHLLVIAQQDDADMVFFQIHHHAAQIIREFQHLSCQCIRKACHAADTIAQTDNVTNLEHLYIPIHFPQNTLNGFHQTAVQFFDSGNSSACTPEHTADTTVINGIAHTQPDAADHICIRTPFQMNLGSFRIKARFLQFAQENFLHPSAALRRNFRRGH